MTLSVVEGKSTEIDGIEFKPEYGFESKADGIYLAGECIGFVVKGKATIMPMLEVAEFRRILDAIDEFIGGGCSNKRPTNNG